ncbi:MAG: tyrosine-type recombinase/integrase [Chloroflexota bacterium]
MLAVSARWHAEGLPPEAGFIPRRAIARADQTAAHGSDPEGSGLPHIRFHDLRPTAASLMMNRQVPILVASRRLGHSKPSVIPDIYSHLYQELQNDAPLLLDELVTPVAVEMPTVSVTNEPTRIR